MLIPKSLILILASLSLAGSILANVTPAPLFQSHAVLQSGKPLPIWGQADAGEKVTVSFAGQTVSTTAGSDGTWKVMLQPLQVNATPAVLQIAGKNSLTLDDILVGEVWLCSGQSNMEFNVSQAANAPAETAAANFPTIRQFLVRKGVANTPQTTLRGNWDVCSPTTVGSFTAAGYFFARELHQKLGVPIGLLHSSWGGSRIEAWNSADAISGSDFQFVAVEWQNRMEHYPTAKAEWEARETAAAQAAAEAQAKGVPYKKKWNPEPANPDGSPHMTKPSNLFNAMIAPLAPAALAGVLWYQGESNVGFADEYRRLFPALITGWRTAFGDARLPFYWVQLPNFNGFGKDEIAWLRDAQTATLSLPGTAQAITIDIGEAANIHPLDKQDVGHRLALLALQKTYQQKLVANGPVFAKASFGSGAATVDFQDTDQGLISKTPAVTGFELAGADRKFMPAEASLDGSRIVVKSATVASPTAVRYAWTNAPVASLTDKAGLPVAPFRSDDWEKPSKTAP